MASDATDPRYQEWEVADHSDSEFVGTVQGPHGSVLPVYYDDEGETLFGAEPDEEHERLRRLDDRTWDVDPSETLGEALDRLGSELGWESLSEFAQSHLETDEE